MELRDLKYFCTAAELGSVTKAAVKLGVSQPFVTKIITQLEREIGTQLFDIENRHIVMNSYGKVFYEHAREVLNKTDELLSAMDDLQGRTENTVRFLYNNAGYLMQLSMAYRNSFPEKVLSTSFAKRNEIIAALNTNQADFALTLPPITGEESDMIETINLFKDSGCLMLPPDSPLLKKEYITLEDMSSVSYVISPKGSGIRDVMDYYFQRYGIKPDIVYETTDYSMQVNMVKSGAGAAVFSAIHKNDPEIGPYCRRIKVSKTFGAVGLSYNKYRHMSKNLVEFKEFMLSFFDKLKDEYSNK